MSTTATRTGLLSGRYALATIGMVAIVGVAAFQNLAMTTIMPVISRDLDGEALYALAFAAPLAAGVPGMVLAGNWTDRAGGRVVAWVSALLFAVGTAVVMLAPTMEVFLVGRLVEGFGAGAIDVVLYVLVARIFPAELHGPVFAGFAAAWVVPALIGPAIAGIVTDTWNWHWVFAGALVIAVGAFTVLVPTLGRLQAPAVELRPPWQRVRIGWSVAAAVSPLPTRMKVCPAVSSRISAPCSKRWIASDADCSSEAGEAERLAHAIDRFPDRAEALLSACTGRRAAEPSSPDRAELARRTRTCPSMPPLGAIAQISPLGIQYMTPCSKICCVPT